MKKTIFFTIAFVAACFSLKAEESLQQYAAKYKFPQGCVIGEINVVFENGILSLTSTLGSSAIEKTNGDQFSIPAYNGSAVFVRNDAKKITGIKIDVKGIVLEGTREEKDSNISTMPVPIYNSTFPIKYLPAMLVEEEGSPIATPCPF